MSIAAEVLVSTDLREAAGDVARLSDSQRELLDAARLRLMQGDDAAAHAVSLVLDRVIQIPVYRWDSVCAKFARLVAQAERSGAPVPAMTELGRDEQYVTASLLGAAPVYKGWSLVADLERRELEDGTEANLVRLARGVDEIPARFRDALEQCTECGVSRRRNRTFIVRHDTEGYAQLGSTCLKRFLGSDCLRAWLTWGALQDAADEWDALYWDDGEFATFRGHASDWGAPIDPMQFLAAVCAEARVHGFASSRTSMAPGLATGCTVWCAMQTAGHEPVTEADIQRAAEIAAFAEHGLRGNFAHNVDTIMRSKVGYRDANTIAALWSIHARESAKVREHVPDCEVGDKVVLDLKVTAMHVWTCERETGWGVTYYDKYRVIFADPMGREVTWVTTSPGDLEVDDRVRAVTTIKSLGEYNGTPQTVISRPTIREQGEVTKSAPVMRKWARTRGFDCPEWAWTKAMRKRAAKAKGSE